MNKVTKSLALERCYKGNASLTPQRLLVLETVGRQKKPISAYGIRDVLDGKENPLNIATIYRVLEFWCELKMVHRLAALNKYVCCTDPKEKHTHIINCCQKCETTYESCNKEMGMDLERGPESLGLKFANDSHLEIPVICLSCS